MAGKGNDDDRNKARGGGDPRVLRQLAAAQAKLRKLKAAEEKRRGK